MGGGENSYLDEDNERYDFTWKGKSESIKISQNPSDGTLRPDKENSKNWDTTENLYIEGDNLEVLKLLQKSYYGKIKMIYLDPPYNTGNDFVYEDNFKDNLKNYLEQDENGFNLSSNPETSGRYHTNWLNMMYPRLKLARNLLKEDGVIFISIDDNEIVNLKKICDEIFGEENFISSFIWQKKSSGGQHSNYVLDFHEYILLYQKTKTNTLSLLVERTEEQKKSFKFSDEYEESRGKFLLSPLKSWLDYRPTLIYDIECPDGLILNTQWICSEPTFKQLKKEGRILFKQNSKKEWSVYKKQYVNEKGGLVKPASLITEYGQTSHGKRELKKLFDNKNVMSFPKPVKLIKYLVSMINKKEEIILDFFSGSATTAEAILDLNIRNNTHNKYIMVQLPEKTTEKSEAYKSGYKNICEIGEERIRRAGDKLLEENPDANIDIGFKVFKLDSSNLTKWNPDVDNLEDSLIAASDNIVEGRSELDLVYEIMLKYGLEITLPVEEVEMDNYTFYSVGMGSLVVCLNNHIKRDVATDVLAIKDDLSPNIMRVVFKDNGFESDSDKTNVKEILRNNDVDEFITI